MQARPHTESDTVIDKLPLYYRGGRANKSLLMNGHGIVSLNPSPLHPYNFSHHPPTIHTPLLPLFIPPPSHFSHPLSPNIHTPLPPTFLTLSLSLFIPPSLPLFPPPPFHFSYHGPLPPYSKSLLLLYVFIKETIIV